MSTRDRNLLRWLALAVLLVVGLLQVRLWSGPGGMPEVWRLQSRVHDQTAENESLKARNTALDADVTDLKQGREAAEERARSELGMVRPGEIFYHVIEAPTTTDVQPPN